MHNSDLSVWVFDFVLLFVIYTLKKMITRGKEGRKKSELNTRPFKFTCHPQIVRNLLHMYDTRSMEFVCWLVAERPSNMRVYPRDGSAQTILRAATLR